MTSIFTPCRRSMRDLRVDRFAARARSATDARAIDLRGDELGIASEKAQEVDILEHADKLAVRAPPPRGACCVLSSGCSAVETQVIGRDCDDGLAGEGPDRRIDRQSLEDRGVHEVGAGDDADPVLVAHEDRIDPGGVHAGDGALRS